MFSTQTRLGEFYLHEKVVKLKGSGQDQTIYYFSKDPDNAVDLPWGYKVKVTRNGLPVLEKQQSVINELLGRAKR